MKCLSARASRPKLSCTEARADQARHQSSQLVKEESTSWKSLAATPLTVNRDSQLAAWCRRGSDIGASPLLLRFAVSPNSRLSTWKSCVADQPHDLIGRRMKRVEDGPFLRGRGRFVD